MIQFLNMFSIILIQSELEERLRHFEAENSRLEIVVKQLDERCEGLKTDLQESQKVMNYVTLQ